MISVGKPKNKCVIYTAYKFDNKLKLNTIQPGFVFSIVFGFNYSVMP